MATAIDTKQLLAAVARLAGPSVRRARHGLLFRVTVTSRDGTPCAVTLQLSDHRPQPSQAIFNDLADRLRIGREEILDALENWTADDLDHHLSQFTAEELRPPAHRR